MKSLSKNRENQARRSWGKLLSGKFTAKTEQLSEATNVVYSRA